MIATVLTITVSAFAVGAAGLSLSTRTSRETWIKFGMYFVIVHAVLLSAAAGRIALTVLLSAIALIGAWELYRCVHKKLASVWWLLYIPLGINLILLAWLRAAETVAYVYLIVAGFDGFSQVSGHLWGKHPLCPRISPNKTIEGALGGALAAAVIAVLLRSLPALSLATALTTAVFLILAAQLGDLTASAIKRQAKIKDFSTLLLGHGGMLDRFDSFLFAATAALLMLKS
jgi:phosphatidate cytidylyltransferase